MCKDKINLLFLWYYSQHFRGDCIYIHEAFSIMSKKLFLVTVAVLGFLAAASAQDDYDVYMQESGGLSLLYRGRQAYIYDILFNGTYWWSTPEFKPGTVRYNGKAYRNVPMNIDAVRQELVVQAPAGVNGKVLDNRYVDSCRIGSEKFINLQALLGPDAPGGYWQVLYDGQAKFLKQVTKKLDSDLDGSKRALTGTDFSEYKVKVTNVFIYKAAYACLTEEGQFVPVRRKQQIANLYKSRKRESRHYMNRLQANGTFDLETYGKELLKYLETK